MLSADQYAAPQALRIPDRGRIKTLLLFRIFVSRLRVSRRFSCKQLVAIYIVNKIMETHTHARTHSLYMIAIYCRFKLPMKIRLIARNQRISQEVRDEKREHVRVSDAKSIR